MGTKDDPFARIEYERRMLADPVTGKIPEDIRTKELKFAKNLPTVESLSLNKGTLATWSMRGPINRGGRTRALGIDVRTQTAPNITIIAGGVSGGIFKSVDNGATWINKLSPRCYSQCNLYSTGYPSRSGKYLVCWYWRSSGNCRWWWRC